MMGPFTVNSHTLRQMFMLIEMTARQFLLGKVNVTRLFWLVSITVKTGFKLFIIRYSRFIPLEVPTIITCWNTDLGQNDGACFMVGSYGKHNTCVCLHFLYMAFAACEMKYCKNLLSLCSINQALRHEGVLGSGSITPPFSTSTLDGGEWSASRSFRFNPRELTHGSHCIGNWLAPEPAWTTRRRKKSCSCQVYLRPPTFSSWLYRLSYPGP
jgi:hypothetical protein